MSCDLIFLHFQGWRCIHSLLHRHSVFFSALFSLYLLYPFAFSEKTLHSPCALSTRCLLLSSSASFSCLDWLIFGFNNMPSNALTPYLICLTGSTVLLLTASSTRCLLPSSLASSSCLVWLRFGFIGDGRPQLKRIKDQNQSSSISRYSLLSVLILQ